MDLKEIQYALVAELEQAQMVWDFRTDADYSEVKWAIMTTEFMAGTAAVGYIV